MDPTDQRWWDAEIGDDLASCMYWHTGCLCTGGFGDQRTNWVGEALESLARSWKIDREISVGART